MSQQGEDTREELARAERGAGGTAGPGAESASELRARKLVAILSVCTAALTLLTAALGVVSVRFNQQKDRAESQVTSLSTDVSVLSEHVTALETDREALDAEITGLEREREVLEQALEQANDEEPTAPDSEPLSPNRVYMSDERRLSGLRFDTGTAQVSGDTYVHSVVGTQGYLSGSDATEAYAEYDLGRNYDEFSATLGLSDKNRNANRTVRFEVIVDNEQIYEVTLTAGEAEPITLAVAGGLRLRLQLTFFRPENATSSDRFDTAVWGDAALVRSTASS